MIEEQKKEHKWEFIFLGANIDAVETAADFGIDKDRAVNYHPDSEGTQLNYEALSKAISGFRVDEMLSPEWKEDIELDFKTRS